MIPEERQCAVARALDEAFGVTEFEEIHPLHGGLSSALVFRIVVRGTPYLLRLINPWAGVTDPTHQFACMSAAADAGVAPRVWYASVEDRIVMTDFTAAKPFPDDLVPLVAPAIRRLHSLPRFAKTVNYLDTMDQLIRRFQAANILPGSVTRELLQCHDTVARVYPRNDEDLVASHNDLNPKNILFDGERVWLIDWEAAFLNDRYVDLAVVANFFVKDEAHEDAYLSAYFGESAGDYRRSRFYLMRQIVHMSFAALLMLTAARSGTPIGSDLTAPDFRDFHRRILSGEVDLATDEAKLQYAKVHLSAVLRNMRTPRFADSVARVGSFHSGA